MTVTVQAVTESLQAIVDPNTGKDLISSKSARNIRVDGADIAVDGDRVTIDLFDPAEGIAPGQAAVIYDGTRVVGSATIASTRHVGARP